MIFNFVLVLNVCMFLINVLIKKIYVVQVILRCRGYVCRTYDKTFIATVFLHKYHFIHI